MRDDDNLLDRPTRIYVAASVSAQGSAAALALQLVDAGFEVTSRWLRLDPSVRLDRLKDPGAAREHFHEWGAKDLDDVLSADTMIVLADVPSSSGGYHVELGIFLGLGRKNIIVVGARPNVFFHLPWIRFFANTLGLVEWLSAPAHGRVLPPQAEDYADGQLL